MLWIIAIIMIGAAYALGSLPFAVIVSRLMRLQDPRTFGSQNPGATNVLRSGNKKAALLTLLGDALKGSVAVWASHAMSAQVGLPSMVVAACVVAVFLGHLFPFTLSFQGGKGVATAVGILLALHPILGLACIITWLAIAYSTRYSSLAAIIAAIMAPAYYLLMAGDLWPLDRAIMLCIVVVSILLLWRHQDNISRLLSGKESRIGQKKKP